MILQTTEADKETEEGQGIFIHGREPLAQASAIQIGPGCLLRLACCDAINSLWIPRQALVECHYTLMIPPTLLRRYSDACILQ